MVINHLLTGMILQVADPPMCLDRRKRDGVPQILVVGSQAIRN